MARTVISDAWMFHYANGKHQLGYGDIVVGDQGVIEGIELKKPHANQGYLRDFNPDRIIVPGAVDTHCHGGGEFYNCTEGHCTGQNGEYSLGSEPLDQMLRKILRAHLQHGTTGMFLTSLATQHLDELLEAANGLYNSDNSGDPVSHARLFGIDIEGSFLYPDRSFTGAQNPEFMQEPTPEVIHDLLNKRDSPIIKKIALDPRWGESAMMAAEHIIRYHDAIPAIAHSGASHDSVMQYILRVADASKQGKVVFVHLGNGPNGSGNKPVNASVMEAVSTALHLGLPVFAENILDGQHLHPQESLRFFDLFGPNHYLGVTDNIGLSEPSPITRFKVAGVDAAVDPENPEAIWVAGKEGVALCGSRATTMDHLLPTFLRMVMRPTYEDIPGVYRRGQREPMFEQPLSFEEAMDYALRALCSNPVDVYGLGNFGKIALGHVADLVELEVDHHLLSTKVARVFLRGNPVDC